MATVAELVFGIVYGAPDKGPLDKAIKDAQDAASKASAPWVTAGKTVAAGVAAAGTAAIAAGAGLFALVDASTKSGDAIAKAARNAGIGTTEFQRLAHAGNLSDVSTQTLGRTVQTLNKQLFEAAEGGAKPFRDALAAVGLTTDDLKGSATENLGTLFDALNNVADEGQRAGLATILLGRGGREMGSLIAEGSEGLRMMGDEAERLGLVIGEDGLAASEAFQDSMTRMEGAVAAVGRTIGIAVAPEVQNITDDITEWAAATENQEELSDSLSQAVRGFGSALEAVLPIMTSIVGKLGEMAEGWGALIEAVQISREEVIAAGVDPGRGGIDIGVGATTEAQLQVVALRRQAQASERAERREREGAARQTLAAQEETLRQAQRGQRDRERTVERRRESAARETLREQERLNREFANRRGRGGRGRGRGRSVDFEAEDFELLEAEEEFGAQIDVLAGSVNATPVQRQAALEAASAARARGASPSVAIEAAKGAIESLTGGKARTSDPTLSSLLGTNVPDVELSALARGAEPQVLVSNIYNTFTFSNDFDINGAGDPVAVAERTVDVMRTTWQDQINQATKTVKVDFAR